MSEFKQLEDLLLAGERERIKALLDERLAQTRAEQLAELPEALPDVLRRAQHDERLARALEKPLTQGLERIAQTNKDLFVSILFPLIGPIIRKSIAESLSQLVRDLNRAMDHSFSPRGLRWRWESIRSGVPFAQVVMRHTLRYRIEHLLLVNNEGGLLLAHVPNLDAKLADSDAVAAMLSALQDFARDAVLAKPGEALDLVSVGGMTLKIFRGPLMHLAVAYRGELDEQVQDRLHELVELTHSEVVESAELEGKRDFFLQELQLWLGQYGQMIGDEGANQAASKPIRFKPWLVSAALLLGIFVSHWAFREWQERKLNVALAAQPGWLLQAHYQGGVWPARFAINGLRDPWSKDPLLQLMQQNLLAIKLLPRWQSYLASEPTLWQQRIQKSGILPTQVDVQVAGQKLALRGQLSTPQFQAMQASISTLASLVEIDQSGLAVQLNPETPATYQARKALAGAALALPLDLQSAAAQQWLQAIHVLVQAQPYGRLQLDMVLPADQSAAQTTKALVLDWLPALGADVQFHQALAGDAAVSQTSVLAISHISYRKIRR